MSKITDERLADARIRFIGAKSRVDSEDMVEVPIDYIDEALLAFDELQSLRSHPAGVRVKGIYLAEAAKHVLLIYAMKVREYDRDFERDDRPENFWQEKYGTNLHSTSLGHEWAMQQALESLSALEPQQKEAVAPVAHLCGLPEFGTYDGQVILRVPEWLREKWPDGMGIDVCLALEIQRLWGVGVRTTGHCCGHGRADGYISVEPDFVQKMLDMGYVEQNHPNGGHFQPKTKLEAQPYERAARIASMYAHHALWHGLIPYGWDETAGRFGVGLANRIADAIRHEARLVHPTPTQKEQESQRVSETSPTPKGRMDE